MSNEPTPQKTRAKRAPLPSRIAVTGTIQGGTTVGYLRSLVVTIPRSTPDDQVVQFTPEGVEV